MTTILIVDDDQNVRKFVRIYLTEQGYQVLEASDGMDALRVLEQERCDIAVVDVMMPYMDGFALTKEIRRRYEIPVILLTAKNQIEDKEQGYEAGTDDYVVKPFEPKELYFRIQALLRRYEKSSGEPVVKIGGTVINKNSYEVQTAERTFLLPLKEFELLFWLMSHPSQVFTRDQLIEQIWGMDYEGDDRTVDVHIKRLRERFAPLTNDFHIKTVRGVGYALEANA
ncbi:response regulator transcription factor [Lysinibacillus odysseyi]|uniref:Heme response regulator HssR n=1 Tax=Lysinibacillus odysseyi 34hs-1 = NBRC 100172 TaxID=1220589 RepID=A0A0A3JFL7_9BACI|nr:response regulator transcription factor [Lysinibacillus odysseyi]KGR85797.1 heme transporter CcmC [Lysinibacillus odysseyi 34hs-1 = NBRC 100172]